MAKRKHDRSAEITRRQALAGLAAGGLVAVGCGSDDETPGNSAAGGGAGTGGTAGSGAGGTGGGAGASGGTGGSGGAATASCGETTTLAASALLAPIENIVVLMMENRSFDHYLGSLKLLEGKSVDGLVGSEANLDPGGQSVGVFKLDNFTPEDPPHGWDASHLQFNGGANDGFVTEHAKGATAAAWREVMGYHVRSQIPITYALADSGAICERWFCSVMGPTWPNRFYLHCAQSAGTKTNITAATLKTKTIWDRLQAKGISCKNYNHGVPFVLGGFAGLAGYTKPIAEFFSDASNGTLPSFSIIDPNFFGAGQNDDHPSTNIQLGQALISSLYAALAASPQWNKTLFVVTYDENGGFYDHVPPPQTTDALPEFAQLGFRVPSLVVGPHVRRGCGVMTQLDHGSVIKTAMVKWGLDAPSPEVEARLAVTNDLSSCIQPAYLASPQPPVTLPTLTIDSAAQLRRPLPQAHTELEAVVRSMGYGALIDRAKANGLGDTETTLRWGQELGVLRLR